jgi:sugar phosphate isomerase/epimerase
VGASFGYKLQLGWREQQRLGELPACRSELYALLADSAFCYVEFSVGPCRAPDEMDLLREETRRCASHGLGVALHPYLRAADNPACFGETRESGQVAGLLADAAALAAGATGLPCALVVHPAEVRCGADAGPLDGRRQQLADRSHAFLAALEEAAGSRSGVVPLAEHQVPPAPGENVIRIGDTFAELLQVVDGLDLGLCWDTGHYLLSVERHGQAAVPPGTFVERVRAVHLHDVVEGKDHCIVSAGSERLARHMRLLLGTGFDGGVTFEYSAEAMREAGSFEAVIARSLEAFGAWMG